MLSEQDINNIDLNYVVLLDSDSAGDLYMEKMYPRWTDVIVVTLDGKYPENPILRERVLRELQTNEKIYCITFGAKAIYEFKVISQKVLHMVDFLFADLVTNTWQKPKLELNEERLIVIMQSFCNKFAAGQDRLQSYNSILKSYKNSTFSHQKNSLRWYHGLVVS